jgi:hypothetical protein
MGTKIITTPDLARDNPGFMEGTPAAPDVKKSRRLKQGGF